MAGYYATGTRDEFALIRLNQDGSLDTTFGVSGSVTTAIGTSDDRAYAVLIQPADGKIVAAGYTFNGANKDVAVVRYTTDGLLDTTFNGTGYNTFDVDGGDDVAYAMAIQSDGKILIAGSYFY